LVISLCTRRSDLLQEIVEIKWHANDGKAEALKALPDPFR
jgi:phage tail protein X